MHHRVTNIDLCLFVFEFLTELRYQTLQPFTQIFIALEHRRIISQTLQLRFQRRQVFELRRISTVYKFLSVEHLFEIVFANVRAAQIIRVHIIHVKSHGLTGIGTVMNRQTERFTDHRAIRFGIILHVETLITAVEQLIAVVGRHRRQIIEIIAYLIESFLQRQSIVGSIMIVRRIDRQLSEHLQILGHCINRGLRGLDDRRTRLNIIAVLFEHPQFRARRFADLIGRRAVRRINYLFAARNLLKVLADFGQIIIVSALGLNGIGMNLDRRGIIRQHLQNLFGVLIGLSKHRLRRLIECLAAIEIDHFTRHIRIANDRLRRLNVGTVVFEIGGGELHTLLNGADIRRVLKQSIHQTIEEKCRFFRIALRCDLQILAFVIGQAEPARRHIEQADIHLIVSVRADLERHTAAAVVRNVFFIPMDFEPVDQRCVSRRLTPARRAACFAQCRVSCFNCAEPPCIGAVDRAYIFGFVGDARLLEQIFVRELADFFLHLIETRKDTLG